MQRPRVLTSPGAEPVSLALLKQAMRITYDTDDTYLGTLPAVARMVVEKLTRMSITRKTFELSLDLCDIGGYNPNDLALQWEGVREGPISMFSAGDIPLPYPPLVSIESVTTYDINNSSSVYSAANYRADISSMNQKGRLCFNFQAVLPPIMRKRNAMVIAYTAGYADGSVPADLVNAILSTAAWAATHRVPCDESACKNCGAFQSVSHYVVNEVGIR
jgi:hypothetical protein